MSVNETVRNDIRKAFHAGLLRVRAVDPSSGEVGKHAVTAVLRHRTPHKKIVQIVLKDGREVACTEDHSLFTRGEGKSIEPVEAGSLLPGQRIVIVTEGVSRELTVSHVEISDPHEHTYDLSVPGPQNFVLTNGVLAHNSYSIGGISLDIEKASKYEALKRNAEEMLDKSAESKARTTKFIRGLQQPRFGIGVRSSFGPHVGRGILSPRHFIGFLLGLVPTGLFLASSASGVLV